MESRVTNSLVMHFDGEGHECGFFFYGASANVSVALSQTLEPLCHTGAFFLSKKGTLWERGKRERRKKQRRK